VPWEWWAYECPSQFQPAQILKEKKKKEKKKRRKKGEIETYKFKSTARHQASTEKTPNGETHLIPPATRREAFLV
jgi:hypothetical protein